MQVNDETGTALSTLGPRDAFGGRGLMRDGRAPTRATAIDEAILLMLPVGRFRVLIEADTDLCDFFARARPH